MLEELEGVEGVDVLEPLEDDDGVVVGVVTLEVPEVDEEGLVEEVEDEDGLVEVELMLVSEEVLLGVVEVDDMSELLLVPLRLQPAVPKRRAAARREVPPRTLIF